MSTRNVMAADRAAFGVVPLALAVLCQDCNCISAAQHACENCASEVLMQLAPVLNREDGEQMPDGFRELAFSAAAQKGENHG